MKALSLWEPFASLMAVNAKTVETRGHPTHYLGPLAICAAKTWSKVIESHLYRGDVQAALIKNGFEVEPDTGLVMRHNLHLGCVVAVVEMNTCIKTDQLKSEFYQNVQREIGFGNYQDGRYGWMTSVCRRLKEPVPVKGMQGLFNLPPDVEAKVKAQL